MRTNHTNTSRTKTVASRTTVFIAGSLSLIVCFLMLTIGGPDVIEASRAKPMSFAQAARITRDERQYVVLEEGAWDCETILYSNPTVTAAYTFFIDKTTPKQMVLLAHKSGANKCADFKSVKFYGYMGQLYPGVKERLMEIGYLDTYPEGTEFRVLCVHCGLGTSPEVVICISALFGGAGMKLLMWVFTPTEETKKKKVKRGFRFPGNAENPFHDPPPK